MGLVEQRMGRNTECGSLHVLWPYEQAQSVDRLSAIDFLPYGYVCTSELWKERCY